ncbi:ABC multidrug transporter [Echria macrotheca]|uniref:ABC multidrug transporter n=1 Tax=Echria macrotheca TaxID=438768 RepID=A0AAJ0F8K6_9PEZI|nr:ABC multidrug transporter [Echria macrotheca]
MASQDAGDGQFGPQLPGGRFDFTLVFEQSILSLPLSCLFLLAASYRFRILLRAARLEVVSTRHGGLYWAKMVIAAVLIALHLALLILWAVHPFFGQVVVLRALAVTSSVLSLAAVAVMAVLIDREHRASIEPSLLLGMYLFLSVLLDLPQARTLFLREDAHALFGVFVVSLALRFALLVAEELPKLPAHNPVRKGASPESLGGAVNRSVFWWLNTFFLRGYRSLIGVGDLFSIPAKFGSARLRAQIEPAWERCRDKTGKNALLYVVLRTFAGQILMAVPPRLALSVVTFSQPLLMKRVIAYVEGASSGAGAVDGNVAGGLIGATALIYVGIAVFKCISSHIMYQAVTMIRGALVGLIFKKTLNLDEKALAEAAPLTLMSTDVEGLVWGTVFIHEIWASAVELGIGIYLLYLEIGVACVLVVGPILVTTMLNEKVSSKIGPRQMAWNQGVQKRVTATSSMLGQMKGIKMTGLSRFFSQRIQQLRATEVGLGSKYRTLNIWVELLGDIVSRFTPIIVITGAIFWTNGSGQGLPISQAFTAVAIVTLVAEPLAQLLGIRGMIAASMGTFTRIQEFLCLEDAGHYSLTSSRNGKAEAGEFMVDMSNASLQTRDGNVLLRDVNLKVRHGSFHMITGLVGCGKTTLLSAIMGQVPLAQGSIRVSESSVAYCAQSPWLRNATVRENVIGGTEFGYDLDWFSKVVAACALDKDFESIPDWDTALVGSGGLTLSGGQKQRVALARAVYSCKKLVLLDDVFSGLDHKTSNFVFKQLMGPNGIFRRSGRTVILTTNQPHLLPLADVVSTIQSDTLVTVEKEVLASEDISIESENGIESPASETVEPPKPATVSEAQKDLKRQSGDTSLYKYYFQSVGWTATATFFALSVVSAGIIKMPQVWLKIWTDHGTNNDTGLYFGIYVMLAAAGTISGAVFLVFYYLLFVPKSGKHLHFLLLDTIMKAPLYFFTTVDSGVTLNRFSQDLTLIDQRLPMSLYVAFFLLLDVIASSILIVAGAQYAAASLPFLFGALYLLQKFYLRTSRQVRFLDLETKSPLYTHFTETMNGAVSVRAFGWETAFTKEHQERLDVSQKPFYLMYCLQRWLTVVLDLLVGGLAVVLVAFAVELTWTSTSSGIGLSFLNLVSFGHNLMGLVYMWTALETSLGAISRVRNFVKDTPKEDREGEVQNVPDGWPTRGEIRFEDVAASYSPSLPPSLQHLTLTIAPGSKVAICGRTGSGKSSTLLTILRLLDLQAGRLFIDDIDISYLPRQTIRTRLASLPQDPVTVPGSVRTNLAPLDSDRSTTSDADLIAALTKAQIWEVIQARGGLDADFDGLGLSPGQRQLFCLAAAAARRSRVVLLDEVTGSVDFETDAEVRRLLASEFGGCTVLEVVHRIEMVMAYDVAVVMEGGGVVEVGKPGELLERGGRFKELWDGRMGG